MKIYRTFYIPNINEDTQNKIVDYWEKRNAQFTRITEREYEAKRGRLLNNLFALRMDKLKTEIHISISDNYRVSCIIDINTMFQHITSWNRRYWDLELDTFESYMLKGDLQEEEWYELTKSSKRKDFLLFSVIFLLVFFAALYFEIGYNEKPSDQLFSSEDGTIQIIAPNDWKTNDTLHEQADLQISNLAKEKYLVIMEESKADFTNNASLTDYASLILDGMKQTVENIIISEPEKVSIDGYEGLQYHIQGEVDKLKVFYYITLIDTPETFNQVVAWSLQSKHDEYKDEFISITSTFKKVGVSEPDNILNVVR